MEDCTVENKNEILIKSILDSLQKLTGLHRQLLETVRLERQALVEANVKLIQELTTSKQSIIEVIRLTELGRAKQVAELAVAWKKPLRDLTLSNVIIGIQGWDLKLSEQFRTALNVLTVLVQRVSEQNQENRLLVEKSLEHIHNMKRNVLGESSPKSNTYTQHGQKTHTNGNSRLISKEI
jgi:hypothetical protein